MLRIHTPLTLWKTFPWRQVLALFCAGLVCTALWAEAEQTRLADHVIRLHVLANSDTEADQALKLNVRDQVLAQTNQLLTGQETAQEAAEILQDNLAPLEETAAQAISDQGYPYPVTVQLEETWFPTRQYENVSLPAGNYQALRVIIGEGAGKNWWCVVFPSLCMPAVTESSLQTAGLTGRDYALLTEESQPYVIKFKAMEWWGTFKASLQDGSNCGIFK